MHIDELIERMNALQVALPAEMNAVVAEAGVYAARMMTERIRSEGIGHRYSETHERAGEEVNLYETGELLEGVSVVSSEESGGHLTATISGLSEAVRKKLLWNAQRYGDFMALEEEERKLVAELIDRRIKEITEKYLGI